MLSIYLVDLIRLSLETTSAEVHFFKSKASSPTLSALDASVIILTSLADEPYPDDTIAIFFFLLDK